MTYKENAKSYIENYGLGIGDKIKVNKEDISYTGILLDRPEDADDGYLVIKLSSGYNIGVAIDNTTAELIEKGENITFEEVLRDIEQRDHNDTTRKLNPLRKAEDALELDTTGLNIDQVTELVLKEIK